MCVNKDIYINTVSKKIFVAMQLSRQTFLGSRMREQAASPWTRTTFMLVDSFKMHCHTSVDMHCDSEYHHTLGPLDRDRNFDPTVVN